MPYDPAHFWPSRWEESGHTGWKDPVIYAFDQIQRLLVVSRLLDSLPVRPQTAIDFGCGSGDFSRLLLERGFRVCGYDPFVRCRLQHPQFFFAGNRRELDAFGVEAGLILSVTVLDHILDDCEFEKELLDLRARISAQGFFVLMEYAVQARIRESTAYQAFRELTSWEANLGACGWKVSSVQPVPHPFEAPSPGYKRYKKGLLARALGPLSRYRPLGDLLVPVLKSNARSALDRWGIASVKESPLKLMLCKPA